MFSLEPFPSQLTCTEKVTSRVLCSINVFELWKTILVSVFMASSCLNNLYETLGWPPCQTLHCPPDSGLLIRQPSVPHFLYFFSSVRLFKYFYFLPSLLKCRLPLRFFPLIAWLPVLVLSLREVLPLIASFGGWLFCTAPHPIWPSSGGKAEWQPHNDQCLRAWLIPHVQTGDWLLGPD